MLWKLASGGKGESEMDGATVRVLVQGPYGAPILSPSDEGDSSLTTAPEGGLGHTLMPSFSGAQVAPSSPSPSPCSSTS
jgi:hypothetical protein